QHLAIAGRWHDKIGPGLKQPAELRTVLREAEEVILLLDHDGLGIMGRALAVDQIAFRDERLMPDAVERLVVLLVEVTRRPDAAPDGLHPSGMPWLGGANKVIDRKVQQPDQIPELRGILIHERRHTLARRRRGRGVRLAVLVSAGQKPHLEAAEAVEDRKSTRLNSSHVSIS